MPSKPSDDLTARPLEEVRARRGQKLVAVRRSRIASLRAFRRIRADRIAGVLGVVGLIFAALLIFVWENPPREEPTWPVEWVETEHAQPPVENFSLVEPDGGPAGPGGDSSAEFTFDVGHTNVSAVVVNFTFQDDIGSDRFGLDQFNVTIFGPEGSNITLGPQVVMANVTTPVVREMRIPLTPLPTLSQAPARTEEEARAFVEANVTESRLGMGSWRIQVDMVRAGDYWDPAVTGTPLVAPSDDCPSGSAACQRDDGNTFTLGFSYSTFEPTFPPPDEG